MTKFYVKTVAGHKIFEDYFPGGDVCERKYQSLDGNFERTTEYFKNGNPERIRDTSRDANGIVTETLTKINERHEILFKHTKIGEHYSIKTHYMDFKKGLHEIHAFKGKEFLEIVRHDKGPVCEINSMASTGKKHGVSAQFNENGDCTDVDLYYHDKQITHYPMQKPGRFNAEELNAMVDHFRNRQPLLRRVVA